MEDMTNVGVTVVDEVVDADGSSICVPPLPTVIVLGGCRDSMTNLILGV